MRAVALGLCWVAFSAGASAQILNPAEEQQLATRTAQLMESTAVAVPELPRLSEVAKQNATITLNAMERNAQNPALLYQFIRQVKAYLALADSLPRPEAFPATADRQYSELRDNLERLQRHFEGVLEAQNLNARKRDADPASLKRYADANSKLLAPGKLPRVVFLGDSITEAWRLNEYFTGRDLVNRGIGNQTTLQMLARFPQDVVSIKAKAVVIEGGINDLGNGIALDQIEANLTSLGDLAKAHGIRVAFASILPVSDYHKGEDPRFEVIPTHPPAAIVELNRWLENFCRAEGFVFANYHAVMVDGSGQMQADLSDDGLHPNAKGYRLMSPIALEAVNKIGGAVVPSPAPGKAEEPVRKRFRMLGR